MAAWSRTGGLAILSANFWVGKPYKTPGIFEMQGPPV